MRPPATPAVENVLRAAIGHGFDGARPWPDPPLGPAVFQEVLRIAVDEGLLGAFAEAVADGSLQLLPEQLNRLARRHTGSLSHGLNMEQQLLRISDAFGAAGIEFRVLKGAALAHMVYADPSWRIAADVDLLIPSDCFDAAVTIAIEDFGGKQSVPELRPGFDREFGKESMVRIGRTELDVHRTFVTGPFGLTISLDELFLDGTEITIGGRKLLGLGGKHQFLHACYNTALGDYPVRLCSVRDLLLCRAHLDIDLNDVVETAELWHGTAVVQRAAQLVVEIAGTAAASGFIELAAICVPRREAYLLRSYLTEARSYSRPLASLAVIPGIRPRLRYARAILAPSAAYLQSRGWTERSHIRRAMGRLRTRD